MALENPWVTYLHRGYRSIKASILNRMKVILPEVTDHSESNILVIIIGSFAGLVEQLNYYLDNIAREAFITTARRYSSMIKLTRLIDYRVKARVGSTVDLKVTAVDGNGNPILLNNSFTLDSGLIIKDSTGTEFITQKKATIFPNSSYVIVGARQGEKVIDENIGNTSSAPGQLFELSESYTHDTLQITINSENWLLVKTFAFSGPEDKHCIVEVNQNKQAFVTFGDGVKGAMPLNAQVVYATYISCRGKAGNMEANTIDTFDIIPTPPAGVNSFKVTNLLPSVGGQDEEDLESIRKRAPLSLRTLDRAVTLQDHRDLCELVPGVGKSDVVFMTIFKRITFYIAPDEGGTASTQLLNDVKAYFESRKMVSTNIQALAAGETKLRLGLTVTARFRRNVAQVEMDIKEALQKEYGFNGSRINRAIRKSDIIALIDNLKRVDYLNMDMLTTKPYPRTTIGDNPLEANWRIEVQPSSSQSIEWRLAVIGANTARLYRTGPSGVEVVDGNINIPATDPGGYVYTSLNGVIKLTIWGSFTIKDQWVFKTYPYNQDHVFNDYTIPVYDENELSLTVKEQVGL